MVRECSIALVPNSYYCDLISAKIPTYKVYMYTHVYIRMKIASDLRREIPALAGQDGDIDVVAQGNLPHGL